MVYRVCDDKGQGKCPPFQSTETGCGVWWDTTGGGENPNGTTQASPRGENLDGTSEEPERTEGNIGSRTEVSDNDLATDLMLYYGAGWRVQNNRADNAPEQTEYITSSGRVSRPLVRFPE